MKTIPAPPTLPSDPAPKPWLTWIHRIATIVLWIVYLLSLVLGASACRTTHVVSQSTTSETFRRGDTTVTSVSIRYEQVGTTKGDR